jgi:DNA-directed RNA polymerase subunit RPC12/RpoP
MNLRKVYPLERFSVKNVGVPTASIRLEKSKYYKCPHCGRRTLVRHREVSPFANTKTPPDFDAKTLEVFDDMGTVMSFSVGSDRILDTYDFFCKGCSRPVRLLYDEQERGMGGFWSTVIHQIVERV